MKNVLLSVFAVLCATLIIAALPTEAEAGIYEDTIRIHILANSNSEADQNMKLEVRDRLLSGYSEIFKGTDGIRDAEAVLRENLSKIESDVCEWAREYGYSAAVSLKTEWYDTRDYDGFSLPAGYYLSLIVELGAAEGKNWWCVMYPPMCLDVATEAVGYTEAENELIVGKYSVKFKILELISKSFGKI